MCFIRKGRHLARCSLRLATCTGFGIGRTRYVTNLIISSYTINYNSNDLLYFVSDITVVCVLSDEEDMWHDALSDSQLVRASDLVEPGTFSFAIMFKLYGGSLACSAPTLAPILYKCINADACCLCIRRFGSTRSSCAGRRFSTRS